jgi:tRNA threonylcarbamoyladenosine biosynthesis protein TsaE
MPIIDLANLDETEAFGRRLGALLFSGAVIALEGQLGAGKTQLARTIAAGLGIADARVVTSPTFILIQEYQARLPIFHFDAYRLRGSAEFDELGAAEYFAAGGVCLVEWSDRVTASLPADRLEIRIAITGPEQRRLELQALGPRHEELLLGVG